MHLLIDWWEIGEYFQGALFRGVSVLSVCALEQGCAISYVASNQPLSHSQKLSISGLTRFQAISKQVQKRCCADF